MIHAGDVEIGTGHGWMWGRISSTCGKLIRWSLSKVADFDSVSSMYGSGGAVRSNAK